MKRTSSEFIDEIARTNPSIEITGNYISANAKIAVRCLICGHEWEVRASHLLEGQGCPVCAIKKRKEMQSKSHQQFVSEITRLHPNIEILNHYINAKTRIKARCCTCGYEWETAASNLSRGSGCPKCSAKASRSRKKITHEQFVKNISRNNPDIELLSTYTGSRNKIRVKCKKCGYEWEPRADSLYRRGCPNCSGKRRPKKTQSVFEQELAEKNPTILVIGQYINTDTKILVQCKKCGYKWKATPDSLLNNHGCPKCAIDHNTINQTKSQETFIKQVNDFNPTIEIIGQYINSHTKVKARCKICNHVWMANPAHLVRDRGCPKCAASLQTSFPEQCLYYYVHKIFSDAINGHKILNKVFDVFVPSINTAIEYDGSRWHNDIEKDIEKNLLCIENGIRIIRIRETGLPIILNADTILRNDNHSDVDLARCIVEVIQLISPKASIDIDINRDRNKIKAQYIITEPKTKQLVEEMREQNPHIKLLSEFIDSRTKIDVQCLLCGYQWSETVYNLRKGVGCPLCKRHHAFIQRLKDKNPTIEVISQYHGSDKKIEVKCRICNHQWSTTPHSLMRGHGCPNYRNHPGYISARNKTNIR